MTSLGSLMSGRRVNDLTLVNEGRRRVNEGRRRVNEGRRLVSEGRLIDEREAR